MTIFRVSGRITDSIGVAMPQGPADFEGASSGKSAFAYHRKKSQDTTPQIRQSARRAV
jgi:hypothetical protein